MNIGGLLIILIVIMLLILLFFANKYNFSVSRIKRSFQGIKPPNFAVKRETEKQLLRLLNGDRRTALRLVENMKLRNPDKTEQWCWEKVIFDLQRDRRS
jgi:replication-associated recombination protein RarA